MTGPLITYADGWRRVWTVGRSQLVAERELDGRLRLAVHDIERPGYGIDFSQTTADAIAAFLRGDQ